MYPNLEIFTLRKGSLCLDGNEFLGIFSKMGIQKCWGIAGIFGKTIGIQQRNCGSPIGAQQRKVTRRSSIYFSVVHLKPIGATVSLPQNQGMKILRQAHASQLKWLMKMRNTYHNLRHLQCVFFSYSWGPLQISHHSNPKGKESEKSFKHMLNVEAFAKIYFV